MDRHGWILKNYSYKTPHFQTIFRARINEMDQLFKWTWKLTANKCPIATENPIAKAIEPVTSVRLESQLAKIVNTS